MVAPTPLSDSRMAGEGHFECCRAPREVPRRIHDARTNQLRVERFHNYDFFQKCGISLIHFFGPKPYNSCYFKDLLEML